MANGNGDKNGTWKTVLAISLALLTITGTAVGAALDSRAYADAGDEKVKTEVKAEAKTDVQAVEERLQAQRAEDKADLDKVVVEVKTAQKDLNAAVSDLKALVKVLEDRSNRQPRRARNDP